MHKLSRIIPYTTHISRNLLNCHGLHTSCQRQVSALYITGDKARENYVTLQPYLDFKGTFADMESLENSIKKRKMTMDLREVHRMFEHYKAKSKEIENVEKEREMIAKQLKDMGKSKDQQNTETMNTLKEQGKELRNRLKSLKNDFYPVEDEFCQAFLHLPNLLDRQCPEGEHERILYRSKLNETQSPEAPSHMQQTDQIRYIDHTRYYLMKQAAKFDLYCTDAMVKYFLQKEQFIQTCNPDFVRCVLLEANATPLERYHKVEEHQVQNKLNGAYLTGGGSFESFLGAVTKLCVYPSVIPLKYICSGRLYERSSEEENHAASLYTAIQTNAVQTFVACLNAQQAEEHMDTILNRCVDFYKTFANLHFRVVYVKAADLMPSESLRAQIEVYSPHEKRYVCVGRISNYKDFVSKRILFTMREQKEYKFLHLIGGPILYTTRLIAALMESQEPLDYQKLMESLKLKPQQQQQQPSSSDASSKEKLEEFKSLFK